MMLMKNKTQIGKTMTTEEFRFICEILFYDWGLEPEVLEMFYEDNEQRCKHFSCKEDIERAFEDWRHEKSINY